VLLFSDTGDILKIFSRDAPDNDLAEFSAQNFNVLENIK
jgi:hypothetical protein